MKQHVQALVQGNVSHAVYSASQLQAELDVEKEAIDRIEAKRIQKLEQEQERYRLLLERQAQENQDQEDQETMVQSISDDGIVVTKEIELPVTNTVVEEEVQPKSNKRRRANVDYSALAEQLFGHGNSDNVTTH